MEQRDLRRHVGEGRLARALLAALLAVGSVALVGAGCSSPVEGPGEVVPDAGDAGMDVGSEDVGGEDVGGEEDVGPERRALYVTIEPYPVVLSSGASLELEATVYDILEEEIVGAPVAWRVLDETVAIVSGEGGVAALAPGRTQVEATSGEAVGRAPLVVEPVATLQIVPDGGDLGVGERVELEVQGFAADGARMHALPAVRWEVDEPSRARLIDGPTLEGLEPGAVEVTARVGDAHATARFLVDEKFVYVTCRDYSCCAISRRQLTYCWGNLGFGPDDVVLDEDQQPIDHPVPYSDVPVRVEDAPAFVQIAKGSNVARCGLTDDGQVFCWGQAEMGALIGIEPRTGWILSPRRMETDVRLWTIDMSHHVGCGLSRDTSDLYCWGVLPPFELPYRPHVQSAVPVLVAEGPFVELTMGNTHLCVLDTQGRPFCQGEGDRGQLGNGSREWSEKLVEVQAPLPLHNLRASHRTTCALGVDQNVWCWGPNDWEVRGHPRDGSEPVAPYVVDVPTRTAFASPFVRLGSAKNSGTFCGVTKDNKVACWGSNRGCELGLPYTIDSSHMPVEMSSLIDDPRQLVLAAFGCALTQEDDLYCWGLKPEFPRFFMSTWGRCEPAVQRVRTYED